MTITLANNERLNPAEISCVWVQKVLGFTGDDAARPGRMQVVGWAVEISFTGRPRSEDLRIKLYGRQQERQARALAGLLDSLIFFSTAN